MDRMPWRRWAVISAVLTSVLLGVGEPGPAPSIALAAASADWRTEFDAVCGRTGEAMSLTIEELNGLIARCEKLGPLIDKLEESERKVFRRRVQLCCDLYRYMLEAKTAGN